MGAGRSELARVLFGLDPCEEGEVRLAGERLRDRSPRDMVRRGVAFLTEDRRSEGLCPDGSISITWPSPPCRVTGRTLLRWLKRDSLQSALRRIRDVVKLDLKAADTQPVRTLSGGNQQKVVLGKWLLCEAVMRTQSAAS